MDDIRVERDSRIPVRDGMRRAANLPNDRSEAVRMDGRQTWRAFGGPAAIEVRLETWQTFETASVRGEVTFDGRPFFARAWGLDLRPAPWQMVPACR